ncbi:putative uncharacterized protein [Blautia hydrogenotrophica CAG:147]|uniref:DUF3800 domain-containing protein n=1 Tax=Blautia hydrogenotrophica TaxID=53443 RepID=UPI00033FFD36|nr:DUF3800 domain-containing protein [Blautia hydrogenotrophica]CCX58815.1 putative uncharacterized protein [Blautia hydrogenotrophica CAG:147]
MILISQKVFFFFDDSGNLHRNEPSGYFVYAGYVFTDRRELESAKRKYIHANKKLKEALGRDDELKAANLKSKHKRALFNSVKVYESVAAVVDISRVYDYILNDKKSICRYKDYVLKRCVKNRLKKFITDGCLSKNEDITISIFIDEQLTATNGYYDLRDSIAEELRYGIVNFDYGIRHPHVFDADVTVNIEYCDSSKNYLIQASDILANRIWTSYRTNNRNLRLIENQTTLTFP